ncbi:MAG: AhpC/TSA family peroxiredoxin [Candidatus Methanohalarchaeum thermophilum]|uniref:Peroxiredoxin n=1 Tax=Methanohalarchaeum thermophilum TaxID=1903181 RepID=A0A1Q6DS91_METT1|nr:MAG: AhpC/TSA family peroxiredoxin [Candidatus Methanohalarchaeum thermophilum]
MNEEQKNGIPLIGEKLPEMEVQTTHGNINIPKDYKGSWLILFSHPADYTPVCTTEFYAFQKRYDQFKELNTELLGLSIDQVFSHMKWTEWIKENLDEEIKFPIIADDRGKVAEKLGMVHPDKGNNTVRAVFIVDPDSTIRTILYYPQELGRNMDEILRIIEGFQTSEKEKAAIPANWPNNELIGNNVIIEPPKSEEKAKKRLEEAKKGKFECYDWWLCHKEI